MLVADYILKFFYEKKVKDIFLLTGGAASFIVDAFSRQNPAVNPIMSWAENKTHIIIFGK